MQNMFHQNSKFTYKILFLLRNTAIVILGLTFNFCGDNDLNKNVKGIPILITEVEYKQTQNQMICEGYLLRKQGFFPSIRDLSVEYNMVNGARNVFSDTALQSDPVSVVVRTLMPVSSNLYFEGTGHGSCIIGNPSIGLKNNTDLFMRYFLSPDFDIKPFIDKNKTISIEKLSFLFKKIGLDFENRDLKSRDSRIIGVTCATKFSDFLIALHEIKLMDTNKNYSNIYMKELYGENVYKKIISYLYFSCIRSKEGNKFSIENYIKENNELSYKIKEILMIESSLPPYIEQWRACAYNEKLEPSEKTYSDCAETMTAMLCHIPFYNKNTKNWIYPENLNKNASIREFNFICSEEFDHDKWNKLIVHKKGIVYCNNNIENNELDTYWENICKMLESLTAFKYNNEFPEEYIYSFIKNFSSDKSIMIKSNLKRIKYNEHDRWYGDIELSGKIDQNIGYISLFHTNPEHAECRFLEPYLLESEVYQSEKLEKFLFEHKLRSQKNKVDFICSILDILYKISNYEQEYNELHNELIDNANEFADLLFPYCNIYNNHFFSNLNNHILNEEKLEKDREIQINNLLCIFDKVLSHINLDDKYRMYEVLVYMYSSILDAKQIYNDKKNILNLNEINSRIMQVIKEKSKNLYVSIDSLLNRKEEIGEMQDTKLRRIYSQDKIEILEFTPKNLVEGTKYYDEVFKNIEKNIKESFEEEKHNIYEYLYRHAKDNFNKKLSGGLPYFLKKSIKLFMQDYKEKVLKEAKSRFIDNNFHSRLHEIIKVLVSKKFKNDEILNTVLVLTREHENIYNNLPEIINKLVANFENELIGELCQKYITLDYLLETIQWNKKNTNNNFISELLIAYMDNI